MCGVVSMCDGGREYDPEYPRLWTEVLTRSEQLLCPSNVTFFNLNWDGRMINHITN